MIGKLRNYMGGMDFGVGVDSLSGGIRGDGVIRTEPEPVTDASGQTISFFLERIESEEDLHKSLGLSVEAEGSYGLFGGSAKFDFAEQSNFHSFSVFLLVRVQVTNSIHQMRDVQLKPQALDLLANGKFDRFREQYGDVYVRGLLTGGEYFATIEITSRDTTEKNSVSLDVEASGTGGVWSFDAAAQFRSAVDHVTKNRNVKVKSFQQGGSDTKVATTPQDIIDKAVIFAEQVASSKGIPYAVLMQDYRALDMPDAPNWVELENKREVLMTLWRKRNTLVRASNDIDYIMMHRDQFEAFDENDLQKRGKDVKELIHTLTTAASRCVNSVKACEEPNTDIPDLSLPKRLEGQMVTVPNVTGLFWEEAQRILTTAGLNFEENRIKYEQGDSDRGRNANFVLTQDPLAGLEVAKGSTIRLTIPRILVGGTAGFSMAELLKVKI